ncbi:MAG TPA: methylated-DNA--[protein]-cysteine S-methyltransferase [Kofleriaceae bacterium]|nr:methylated-DNA--[protein]-cysteine S-methyltransferase [Kofleriaceae bacterium]
MMTMPTMPAMLTMLTIDSPLGPLRLYAAGDALTGLYLPRQAAPPAPPAPPAPAGAPPAPPAPPAPVLARAAAQLAEYFAGARRDFDVPLLPRGTDFQALVWRELTRIPYGETRTYGELARGLGRPSASRAVGAANGKNPISILVPCHRVIAGSGALTGYAGGLDAKRWLLAHEARAHAGLFARAG